MKLNNRGLIHLFVLAPFLIGAGYEVIVIGAMKADYSLSSFRERKANEYCITEGQTPDQCKNFVSGMDKSEILAYIKDTQAQPRI